MVERDRENHIFERGQRPARNEVEVVHISSAVVRCLPPACDAVCAAILGMDSVEVVLVQDNKLILIIEGPTARAVGSCLTRISALEGVVSAVMVYEHVETSESLGEDA
jgi:periplasmic nitrate reductase NapD